LWRWGVEEGVTGVEVVILGGVSIRLTEPRWCRGGEGCHMGRMGLIWGMTVPSRMSKATRNRVSEAVGASDEVIAKRLEEMQGGVWSSGKRAEYGVLMREMRRREGLIDGLRLEKTAFDEYLRKRNEDDAKWRCGSTTERKASWRERANEPSRGSGAKRPAFAMKGDVANAVDYLRAENERLRARLRAGATAGGPSR